MRIAIGNDELGINMKEKIIELLESKNIEYIDFGMGRDDNDIYPNLAEKVALSIKEDEAVRGILICGTGIGMAITANKIPGIRAAQVHDPYSAQRSRMSNNAQIITFGAKVISTEVAVILTEIWLESEFVGGQSKPKVDRIMEIENNNR